MQLIPAFSLLNPGNEKEAWFVMIHLHYPECGKWKSGKNHEKKIAVGITDFV